MIVEKKKEVIAADEVYLSLGFIYIKPEKSQGFTFCSLSESKGKHNHIFGLHALLRISCVLLFQVTIDHEQRLLPREKTAVILNVVTGCFCDTNRS